MSERKEAWAVPDREEVLHQIIDALPAEHPEGGTDVGYTLIEPTHETPAEHPPADPAAGSD